MGPGPQQSDAAAHGTEGAESAASEGVDGSPTPEASE